MHNNVFDIVCQSIMATLNLDETHAISLQSRLKDDLGLDSMSTLSFLMSLEDNIDNFIVDPDSLDANDLDTVETVVKYVNSQLTLAEEE